MSPTTQSSCRRGRIPSPLWDASELIFIDLFSSADSGTQRKTEFDRFRFHPGFGNRRGGATAGIADTALLVIDIPIDLIGSFQVEGVSQIGYI